MAYTLVAGAAPVADSEEYYRRLLREADHVVAADGAGEWCVGLGRVPDVVVGDFDSADEGAPTRLAALGARIETHPTDKDLTDLELATELAVRTWPTPVCLTAAFTGRIDHTLAGIGLITRAGKAARIAEPGWRAWACSPSQPLRLDLPAGATYSIVAIGPCSGVTARGGRWELEAETLQPLSGRGVSNEATGSQLNVSVREGDLIVLAVDVTQKT
jgi:thiamine pyrophosphokinase